jgi:hypothetical protein
MDLNNTSFSTQKKATMLFNASASYTTKQAQAGLISHHSTTHPHHSSGMSGSYKHQFQGRSRIQNMNNPKAGGTTGPMQLEPNPVFSIIDQQMDKMNRDNERILLNKDQQQQQH